MKWRQAAAITFCLLAMCCLMTVMLPVGDTLWSEALYGVGSVNTKWTPTPSDHGCTYSHGYWKNHTDWWPVDSLMLGNVLYSKSELIDILNMPTKNNASIFLARQLVAAKLNIASGASPSAIADVILAADTWLAANPVGSNPGGEVWEEGMALAETLDNYNMGLIGPGYCLDTDEDELIEPNPVPTQTVVPTPVATISATLAPVDVPRPTATAVPSASPPSEDPTIPPSPTATPEPPTATPDPLTFTPIPPSPEPSATPTAVLTTTPTAEPTTMPTAEPTTVPTAEPTAEPTTEPTAEPTEAPTSEPPPEPTAVPPTEPPPEPTAASTLAES